MKICRRLYFLYVLFSMVILMAFNSVPIPKKAPPHRSRNIKKVESNKKGYHSPNRYFIIIDKSEYELKVYDAAGWYATYPVVFGRSGLADKMQSGDKKTPEGHFTVIQKKIHPKWSYELLLDYPTGESIQLFEKRKRIGLLPKNATIGNGIAIHATRPEEEWTVDNFYNWTDGCVSAKYSEMKDLYSYIPVGTPVTIQQ